MPYINIEDFYQKVCETKKMSREEEKSNALKMKDGNAEARQAIINSYLPMVASYVKRAPKEIQTLQTVYCCIRSLEEGVDRFDLLQDSETFIHHLSWRLRQCITECIANRH